MHKANSLWGELLNPNGAANQGTSSCTLPKYKINGLDFLYIVSYKKNVDVFGMEEVKGSVSIFLAYV